MVITVPMLAQMVRRSRERGSVVVFIAGKVSWLVLLSVEIIVCIFRKARKIMEIPFHCCEKVHVAGFAAVVERNLAEILSFERSELRNCMMGPSIEPEKKG